MEKFNQAKYIQKYKKENYSRAIIDFKKDEKILITEHWKNNGYKSFSEYIRKLIYDDIKKTQNR